MASPVHAPVHVLGVGRTDFKRNLVREGRALRDVVVEAARAALADASVAPADVQAGVVGNFASGQYTSQGHLGALLCDVDPALRGLPTFHAEAACASGSVAVLSAVHQIAAGLADVVLVVGAEQQKTMPVAQGADVLAGAGDYRAEKPEFGPHVFPGLFGRIASLYRERHGLSDRALATVAAKNRLHAALNPLAQMRESPVSLAQALAESEANPVIASPLKLADCSQITDGAAALVLCSDAFARRLATRRSVRLLGFGHTTDHLDLARKDVPAFPVARRAAEKAYAMARVGPADLDAVEVHDCFSITEVLAYELLGLAAPGQGHLLAESGRTAHPVVRDALGASPGPRAPVVNPGGGLIGDGHPVGATGVRQVVEAVTQLRGEAGPRQVDGARTYATFNMGGTLTTSVAMVWSR